MVNYWCNVPPHVLLTLQVKCPTAPQTRLVELIVLKCLGSFVDSLVRPQEQPPLVLVNWIHPLRKIPWNNWWKCLGWTAKSIRLSPLPVLEWSCLWEAFPCPCDGWPGGWGGGIWKLRRRVDRRECPRKNVSFSSSPGPEIDPRKNYKIPKAFPVQYKCTNCIGGFF